MALSAATVWEIRPATGSDTNGGGFVAGASGTDRSQQASAQIAYTDLVATSTTTATSAGHPFTSAEVGNIIQVTSGTGWTAGFYQIVSVTTGTATFDRAIATNGATGGHANLGGALATMSAAIAAGIAGNTFYMTGTLTVTAAQTISFSSSGSQTKFIGYGSARGDGTQATWTTATNSVDLIQFTQAANLLFQNLEFKCTAGTAGNGLRAKTTGSTGFLTLDNCDVHGCAVGVDGNWTLDWAFPGLVLLRSRIYSNVTGVFNSAPMLIYGCYIHDNSGDGVKFDNASSANGQVIVDRCVIKSNGGKGINCGTQAGSTNGSFLLVKNSCILNNTGDGISSSSTPTGLALFNNIIDSNGGFGVNLNSQAILAVGGANAFRSNTSGDVQNWTKFASDITLTGDPFTNRSGADFSLNSTAGAGAACKGVAVPTAFP